ADHDGKLSNAKEFAFTEWDSTAKGDLEALKNIFDTNHNGKLDAGDAKWADFKVLVDGQMKSLSELGIASIDLTPSGSGQSFSDGSAITGTTTFTRTNGTTGAAGDAVLATESGSYIVKQTKTTNADGSVTTDILGYNADGSKAFENVVTVNAAGTSRTIKYDDNGDGVFDRSQTVTDSKWQTYSNVEMVSNYNADGSLRDSARTERSTDLHWVKTELDQNGDGIVDQRQLQNLEADGSTTTTTSNLAVNGTTINQTQVIASANGLSKTTKVDHAGSGTFDQITTDVTVVDAGGNRTQTVTDTGSNGTVLDKTVTITSTDRATSTIQTDEDGNGSFDTVEQISRSVAPDGTHVTWVVDYNADGSKRTIHTTNISADGLGKTEYFDRNSDGPADEIRFDGTVIASDGSRTQTVWDKSGNGTLLSQTVTVTSSDKKTITITTDANGDGATDQTTSIVVGADGSTTKMISNFGPNGTLISR
ncbi:adhesin, partial [Labrys portucalensis]